MELNLIREKFFLNVIEWSTMLNLIKTHDPSKTCRFFLLKFSFFQAFWPIFCLILYKVRERQDRRCGYWEGGGGKGCFFSKLKYDRNSGYKPSTDRFSCLRSNSWSYLIIFLSNNLNFRSICKGQVPFSKLKLLLYFQIFGWIWVHHICIRTSYNSWTKFPN